MSVYEVGRDLFNDIKHVRRLRHVSQVFRFVRTKKRIVRRHTTLVRAAPREPPCLVSLGRDEKHLTKAFLAHYKDLGFRSFIFLDNGSTDGSVSHLVDEANALDCDVTIYRCDLSYGRYKHAMKNFLLEKVPTGAWTLCADNDEFLVLPDGVSGVGQIIGYLEARGYDTVQFHLLDMFSRRPFHDLMDETAWSLADLERQYPCFDISTLRSTRINRGGCLRHRGGVRLKHFGVRPLLTKATFLKKMGETNLRSSHSFLTSLTSRPRRMADFTLFAKHYKFNSRYPVMLQRAVHENSYYDNSSECRAVLERLTEDASYTLDAGTTLAYQNCQELLARDFVTYSKDFREYLESLASR